jgi:aminopeptidase
MHDPRIEAYAKQIINYSLEIKPGEKILIEQYGKTEPLTKALINAAYEAGGIPFVTLKDETILRVLLNGSSKQQLELMAELELNRMKQMQAYIGIRSGNNINEMSSLPAPRMKAYSELFQLPVHLQQRVKHTRWCVLRYPNDSMAQLAQVATDVFEDFYFKVCVFDYAKMSKAMDALVKAMMKTDRVRLTGKGTDLSFSIKGMPAIKCDGKINIPDGEVFSAPIRDSVNGRIAYNTPSVYQGYTFENIGFEFKDGKIIKASSNDTDRINEILDRDEGARYVGEFSLGVNPYILKPMNDTLFDEKISGSIHFTPGACYDNCDNQNQSAIHWDLVLIQRPEYGGGEIWFDDILVRKNGIFVLDELKCLNPENLI